MYNQFSKVLKVILSKILCATVSLKLAPFISLLSSYQNMKSLCQYICTIGHFIEICVICISLQYLKKKLYTNRFLPWYTTICINIHVFGNVNRLLKKLALYFKSLT